MSANSGNDSQWLPRPVPTPVLEMVGPDSARLVLGEDGEGKVNQSPIVSVSGPMVDRLAFCGRLDRNAAIRTLSPWAGLVAHP